MKRINIEDIFLSINNEDRFIKESTMKIFFIKASIMEISILRIFLSKYQY